MHWGGYTILLAYSRPSTSVLQITASILPSLIFAYFHIKLQVVSVPKSLFLSPLDFYTSNKVLSLQYHFDHLPSFQLAPNSKRLKVPNSHKDIIDFDIFVAFGNYLAFEIFLLLDIILMLANAFLFLHI